MLFFGTLSYSEGGGAKVPSPSGALSREYGSYAFRRFRLRAPSFDCTPPWENEDMSFSMPEEELFKQLSLEFGAGGQRAVEFLRTADGLIHQLEELGQSRSGEIIAYCIREALQSIPDSYRPDERMDWAKVSREVVKAKGQFSRLRGKQGENEQGALNDLLAQIDLLDEFHSQESKHRDQLQGIYRQLTGQEPPTIQPNSIDTYLKVFAESKVGLHSEMSPAEARHLFQRAMNAVRQMFLPLPQRKIEFGKLAKLDEISQSDIDELRSLISSLNHLTRFFEQISTPVWLVALIETDLVSPDLGSGFWPARVAVRNLRQTHSDELVVWMTSLYAKQKQISCDGLQIVAEAAEFGEQGASLVLQGLQDHPTSDSFVHYSLRAFSQVSSESRFVDDFADILFNESSWPKNGQARKVMEKFVVGVNQENAISRITLICQKLRKIDENQRSLAWFKLERGLSIADWDSDHDDRFGVLLSGLTQIVSGQLVHFTTELLLEQFELLPNLLRERLASWVLTESTLVTSDCIIGEIARAIESRFPNGDDGPLIQKILNTTVEGDFVKVWSESLQTAVVKRDHSDGERHHQSNRRITEWTALLPRSISEAAGVPISDGRTDGYLLPHRSLSDSYSFTYGVGTSPYSIDELSEREPIDIAEVIGNWKQDRNNFLVSPLELARNLAEIVKAAPDKWTVDQFVIVRSLKFPIYIQHYLSGLCSSIRDGWNCSFNDFWGLIDLLANSPWSPPAADFDERWLSNNWKAVEVECINLIKAFADNHRGFGEMDADVWNLLKNAVRDRSEASSIVSGGRDHLDYAINRPCTQALEAALSFISHQYRVRGEVASDCLDLLEEVLRVEGLDGAQYRSILATRLNFLDRVAPDWLLKNSDVLMGDAAPAELALATCEMAIKWGHPSGWLFRNHMTQLRTLVLAGAERAVDQLVVAMIWDMGSCAPAQICGFLTEYPERISSAGESLARLLRQSKNDRRVLEIAVEFWECALEVGRPEALYGFGWMSEVADLDEHQWVQLMLRTVQKTNGKVDWGHGVLKRLISQTPVPAHCEITNHIIRGTESDWERFAIERSAVDVLNRCGKFSGEKPFEQLRTALEERGIID